MIYYGYSIFFIEVYMADTGLVQIRLDSKTKKSVAEIYENLGLDLPTAIRIFLKKSIAARGLPFELRDEGCRWNVYENARKAIQKNSVPEMSLSEINTEISAARKSSKK